ncbi:MAG TPA: hypothetical protein VK886_05115 [Vicinamibacterales bacterium]|nr:hypothetical protein [Vicinamibacterales bacterium]
MGRGVQFLIECAAALLAAGILLAAAIPLLHLVVEPVPRAALQALVWSVGALCLMLATLRPGGSLRR